MRTLHIASLNLVSVTDAHKSNKHTHRILVRKSLWKCRLEKRRFKL